jgi:surface antigen Omp85-like protein
MAEAARTMLLISICNQLPADFRKLFKRSTTMRSFALVAALLVAIPVGIAAQDKPPGGPNPDSALARTATSAILGDDFPDPGQHEPALAAIRAVSEPEGFLPEPRFIGRAIDYTNRTVGDSGRQNNGFYPEFSNMITGSGWISAGPGYRQWLFAQRALVDVSSAISWRSYKVAQGRFELPNLAHSRITVGSQVLWQDATQITYFGVGPNSTDADRSEYRMKTTDVVGYAAVRPLQWLSIGGRVGWLQQPTILSPAGTFLRGNPATLAVFPGDATVAMPDQPSYLHTEASLTADTRNSRSHPQSGGVYRAAFSAYADQGTGAFSFRRYEAEAAHFVPLADDRVVLIFHGWGVASETGTGEQVPFYLLPSLGGNNTLRSYTDFRFHDRNLLVINAESRFAVMKHVDLAAFVDAGNVAARVGDLNLDKRAYGLGVRLHSDRATFGRLDLAHGTDGWQVIFRTNDPFHLSRLSRRTAATPFVP